MDDDDIAELWGEEPDWVREFKATSEDDDEATGEDEDADELAPAQHVMVLIDCAPSMFQDLNATNDADNAQTDFDSTRTSMTAMDWSLQAFKQLYRDAMKSAVIHKAGKRNGIGALLYNTRAREPLVMDQVKKKLLVKEEKAEHDESDDTDDDDYDSSISRIDTVHELVPLDIPNTPMLQRVLATLPDQITHERRIDIAAEFGHVTSDHVDDDDDCKYDSHVQLPIYRGLEQAKKILDAAKCVRHKPNKVKGKMTMPPDSMQIWILTNQDKNPCHGDAEMLAKIKERIEELDPIKVYIWQLPTIEMMVPDIAEDMEDATEHECADLVCKLIPNPFFTNVGMVRPRQSEETPLDQDNFTRVTFRLNLNLRPSFSVPLLLPNWKSNPDYPGIQLDLYKIVKKASKPTALRFHNETGQLMARTTKITTENELIEVGESITGHGYRQILPEDRIKLFAPLRGGKDNPLYVEMRPNDLVVMKRACNGNPDFASLVLSGFKPRDRVRFFDSIGECYFMYPQESKVAGSSKAFAQLFYAMQRKNVLAVGEMLTRVSATSRCVAFWPVTNDGTSNLPPQEGMVMVYLPFQDECRTLPPDKDYAARMSSGRQLDAMDVDGPDPVVSHDVALSSSSAPAFVSSALVDATVELIKKQSLNDRVLGVDFENAYITEFYNYLESQSLGTHWEPTNDYDTIMTEEHERAILDAVGEQIEAIKNLLPDDEKATGKRKSVVSADPDAGDTGIDWEQEFDDGRIGKVTVPNLKKYCQAHGLTRTGNKGDLVQRVCDHIAERRAAYKAVKQE
ncbi:hypothetical protein MPSEU_000993100 [Mayamaea pseudoterrestris]|nr:hypothetical protein MPSEU_000993100 [Mayamaea pseudoterrestris]